MIVEIIIDICVIIKFLVEIVRFIFNYVNKCCEEVRKSVEDMGSEVKIF